MRINVPLGASLTRKAELPAGAERSMKDPYEPSHTGRTLGLLAVLLAALGLMAWRFGWLTGVMGG